MGFMDKAKKAAETAQAKAKQAAESAQAATSKVGVGASADQMAIANKAQRLTKSGVDTSAHIDSMSATGNTDTPGGTGYVITLTVKPASGESYQATTNQYIYPSAPFSEGQDVTVKVDPEDSTQVLIFGAA
jgi:hypothetical protein